MTPKAPLIAINLCSIRPGQLSGPSVYATWLTEELLKESGYRWLVYCHQNLDLPDSWSRLARIRRVLSTMRKPLRIAFEQCLLPRLAERDQVDLLFSPNFVSPLWGSAKRAVTIHDLYYEVMPHVLPRWQRIYWRHFVPLSAKRSHAILAVSRCTARDLQLFVPGTSHKTWVTPLACAVDDPSSPGVRPQQLTGDFVLWVANVVGNKNPEVVAAMAAELKRRGVPMRVVHVGSDVHGLFAAAIAEQGDHGNVLRLGRVDAAHLRWLYKNATCVVQPSHYEGFGIPVLEAQKLGAPLICSDVPPLREVAGAGALYFTPTDFVTLANHIEFLRTDDVARRELCRAGSANASGYSWQLTAKSTIAAFEAVLNCPSARA